MWQGVARLISPGYLAQQRALHTSGDYGRSGDRWADLVETLAREIGARTVLDYGCGKGHLGEVLRDRGMTVFDYDPAMPGKEYAPVADLVVCTDVMEHIEPEKLTGVIDHLGEVARFALFMAISTRPAGKTLPDGRNAHLIIASGTWWRSQFKARGFGVDRLWYSREEEWVVLMRPPRGTDAGSI